MPEAYTHEGYREEGERHRPRSWRLLEFVRHRQEQAAYRDQNIARDQ